MEYDRIILEMLDRIKTLEDEVAALKNGSSRESVIIEERIKISKKYRKLTETLRKADSDIVSMSFGEIESIIEDALPNSARNHRAFWANTTTHSIAHGWLAAGYKVVDVNMISQTVVFEKYKGL